jgi:hypothetical protein
MKKLTNDAIDAEMLNKIAATLNKSFGDCNVFAAMNAAMKTELMATAFVKFQEQERDRVWRDDPLQLKAKYLDPGTRQFKESVGLVARKVKEWAEKRN